MGEDNVDIKLERVKKRGRKRPKMILPILIILLVVSFANGFLRPTPKGTSFESQEMMDSHVEFLYDLTYEKNGQSIKEQRIFKEQLALIEEARDFIILDMFLFNDAYKRDTDVIYPNLSGDLTAALIEKKKKYPDMNILFITDEINNFYGVYESPYISELKANNIPVIVTNLEKVRDSNPSYAGIWRTLIKWFGTKGKGWLPNAFSPDSPKVTLRGYLKLLNFKANHRKVLITEDAAIITSMNPHDASGNHSNIAFKVKGLVIKDLVETELTVARFSGYEDLDGFDKYNFINTTNAKVSVITEGKISDSLIKEIKATEEGDIISMGMFYIGQRKLVKELINASNRGVEINLVFDANKDAFGLEKDGVPNRAVASEMIKKSDGKIQIKWYNTKGEQFHTKLTYIEKFDKSIAIGGSANLTRRNIDDYNLETNLKIEVPKYSRIDNDLKAYFYRIWSNETGNYTLDYEAYEEKSLYKTIKYRIQEGTGLSSF